MKAKTYNVGEHASCGTMAAFSWCDGIKLNFVSGNDFAYESPLRGIKVKCCVLNHNKGTPEPKFLKNRGTRCIYRRIAPRHRKKTHKTNSKVVEVAFIATQYPEIEFSSVCIMHTSKGRLCSVGPRVEIPFESPGKTIQSTSFGIGVNDCMVV